ncbi:hypothetical protein ACOI1H_08190 [Loktanella sp. DJP18]|uniref:hypothetical protein n=1 Tax=Loktanella sp. DJP18 TaxID=3409788 RepID=UPI003BB71887
MSRLHAVMPGVGALQPPSDNPCTGEIDFCAWVAQAMAGERLVYHRGFLAFDAMALLSDLPPGRQRALRDVAAAAMRAAEQDLVHLVQARLGPGQFAYIAVARRKPKLPGALSVRLLQRMAA